MNEINQTPPTSPAPAGQPGGVDPQGTTPTPAAGTQPSGGDNSGVQTVVISLDEANALKRKAGRWDAYQKNSREDRRNNHRSTSDYDADNAPPALLDALKDRDIKIDELSSAKTKLEVKDKVRDLLDGDEYKDLTPAVKRAVVRNPLGFAKAGAQSVEEAIADIQDYLDDELDSLASGIPAIVGGQPGGNQNPTGNQPAPAGGVQTPPASGSGPSNPSVSPTDGTEGKTGKDRSVSVLQNILKNGRK